MEHEKRTRFLSVVALMIIAAAMIGVMESAAKSHIADKVSSAVKGATTTVTDTVTDTVQNIQPGYYTVVKFTDGDTIDVNMDGHTETVRFIGVDTPETHKPNSPVQCYGPQAADNTKKLIGTNPVRLEADPLDTDRDRYGRLLRYVYLPDGTNVEASIIQNGYGFAYTLFPFSKKEEFKGYQATAQTAKAGLWSVCQVHKDGDKYQTQNL